MNNYLPAFTLLTLLIATTAHGDDFFTKQPSSLPQDSALNNGSADSRFLPVEQAFAIEVTSSKDFFTFSWQIAADYYLYKRTLKILTIDGRDLTSKAELSRAIRSFDGYFGPVEVFYYHAQMRIPRAALKTSAQIQLSYQGCAEAGLCYPVQTRVISL